MWWWLSLFRFTGDHLILDWIFQLHVKSVNLRLLQSGLSWRFSKYIGMCIFKLLLGQKDTIQRILRLIWLLFVNAWIYSFITCHSNIECHRKFVLFDETHEIQNNYGFVRCFFFRLFIFIIVWFIYLFDCLFFVFQSIYQMKSRI